MINANEYEIKKIKYNYNEKKELIGFTIVTYNNKTKKREDIYSEVNDKNLIYILEQLKTNNLKKIEEIKNDQINYKIAKFIIESKQNPNFVELYESTLMFNKYKFLEKKYTTLLDRNMNLIVSMGLGSILFFSSYFLGAPGIIKLPLLFLGWIVGHYFGNKIPPIGQIRDNVKLNNYKKKNDEIEKVISIISHNKKITNNPVDIIKDVVHENVMISPTNNKEYEELRNFYVEKLNEISDKIEKLQVERRLVPKDIRSASTESISDSANVIYYNRCMKIRDDIQNINKDLREKAFSLIQNGIYLEEEKKIDELEKQLLIYETKHEETVNEIVKEIKDYTNLLNKIRRLKEKRGNINGYIEVNDLAFKHIK